MKVLDLQCELGHRFEAWFGSETEFQTQLAQGILSCPMCGSATLTKMLSAPRLNLMGAHTEPTDAVQRKATEVAVQPPAAEMQAQLHAAWLAISRHVVAHSENVGERFAEEARKMHYGEADSRAIRGQTSSQELRELHEEGIGVMPIAFSDLVNQPLH